MGSGLDFELDIEQRLRGGDTISQLDKFDAAYRDAKTANADFTREALKATAALEKNASAIADTKTQLLAAIRAGDEKQVQKLTAKFGELSRAEKTLKSDVDAAKTALDKQTKLFQTSADKVGMLKKREAEHDKALELAGKHGEQHAKTLQKLTGRAGEAADKLSSMGNDLGTVGALTSIVAMGTIALVAAVVAAAAAFVAGAAALAQYAIGLANVHRNQGETLRAMTQSNEVAAQLNDAYTTIEKGTGVTADRLTDMTRSLTTGREQMGLARLSGNQLERALYSLSEQEQALGDSSGTSTLIDQLNSGALSVEQLGDRIDQKYSNVVEKKMLGLDQQLSTLKANVAGIFENINIEPILRGLSRLVALFDTSTASGKAIQTLFEAIFGPVVSDNADKFFVGLERMILKAELSALKFGIMVKKAWKTVNDAIDSVQLGPLGSLRDALDGLKEPFGAVTTKAIGMLTPLGAIAETVDTIKTVFGGIGKWLLDAYTEGKKWVDKLVGLGDAIVDGLRDKIAGGADKVAGAIAKVMKGSVTAAKGAIGMASPPRAYLEIGKAIPEATAGAINDGAGSVGAAVDSMLAPPEAPAKSGGASFSSSVQGNHFHMHGVEDGADALNQLEDLLVELLNRRNAQVAAEAT